MKRRSFFAMLSAPLMARLFPLGWKTRQAESIKLTNVTTRVFVGPVLPPDEGVTERRLYRTYDGQHYALIATAGRDDTEWNYVR